MSAQFGHYPLTCFIFLVPVVTLLIIAQAWLLDAYICRGRWRRGLRSRWLCSLRPAHLRTRVCCRCNQRADRSSTAGTDEVRRVDRIALGGTSAFLHRNYRASSLFDVANIFRRRRWRHQGISSRPRGPCGGSRTLQLPPFGSQTLFATTSITDTSPLMTGTVLALAPVSLAGVIWFTTFRSTPTRSHVTWAVALGVVLWFAPAAISSRQAATRRCHSACRTHRRFSRHSGPPS